jgi:hypothetical protein
MNNKPTPQAAVVLMEHALISAEPLIASIARSSRNRAARESAKDCLKKLSVGLAAAREAIPLNS